MIKNLLWVSCFVISICFNQPALAQNSQCFEGYSFKKSSDASANSITNDIIVSWDISNVNNKQNLKLEIEVQPLDNCWDLTNGTLRSEKRTYDVNSSLNDRGQVVLKFSELNAKCLKWRVKMTNNSNNCSEFTPWEFASLLN